MTTGARGTEWGKNREGGKPIRSCGMLERRSQYLHRNTRDVAFGCEGKGPCPKEKEREKRETYLEKPAEKRLTLCPSLPCHTRQMPTKRKMRQYER